MTTFEEEVQAVLDGLPSQELVDRGVVVDALLDLFGAAGDDGERVTAALRELPAAGLLERSVATSTLLGLLDPSSNCVSFLWPPPESERGRLEGGQAAPTNGS